MTSASDTLFGLVTNGQGHKPGACATAASPWDDGAYSGLQKTNAKVVFEADSCLIDLFYYDRLGIL